MAFVASSAEEKQTKPKPFEVHFCAWLAASDGAKRLEFGAKFIVVNVMLESLDVEVDTLILGQLLHLGMLVRLTQLLLTLSLLLGARDEKSLSAELRLMRLIDGLVGFFVLPVVDKPETLVPAFFIDRDQSRDHVA
jgi:hypothetical protein